MNDTTTLMIESFDGTQLAVHRLRPEQGGGRPVLLLHGLFSTAYVNWIQFGHAQALADAGFEAIMPDMRAHGASDKPHEARAYPHDVLVRDVAALVEALELDEYDLCGFSLGARTAVHCAISGMSPRRLVIAGMGLEGLFGWQNRSAFFIDAIDRFDSVRHGDPAYLAVQFMKTMKTDRKAARLLLRAVDDVERSELGSIGMPALVISGDKDRDNGSPEALAEALRHAQLKFIPGTHMSCVTKPELGLEIARFLAD